MLIYIVIAVVAVLVLAALAYYATTGKSTPKKASVRENETVAFENPLCKLSLTSGPKELVPRLWVETV
jgi:hypothetical protein